MTKRTLGWSVLGVIVIGVVGMQLIPYGRNHVNPAVQTTPVWDSPRTRDLFTRACADCHSNETVWPWYSNIAPVSWLVQRDVDKGRARFNISTGDGEAEESAETISNGKMPLPIYTVLHPDANLSAAEKQDLMRGLQATLGGAGRESNEGKNNESSSGDD